jgi:hypothetical protein
LRARQYDPATGRFASTDPRASLLADPYLASYAYVGNMPTRYADPSGQCFILCGAAAGAVIGGFVSAVSYAATAGSDFTAEGLIGHAAVGAVAGAVTGATMGLAGGGTVTAAALPFVERAVLQATGGYVGSLVSLAGARLLGDRITPLGAALQMVLGTGLAFVAPRMSPSSTFWDQLHPRSWLGTQQAAAGTAVTFGLGFIGTAPEDFVGRTFGYTGK